MKLTNQNIIYLHRINTPIGEMFVGATENGLCLLAFSDQKTLENMLKNIETRYSATLIREENQHIKQTQQELAEYFAGKRKNFTVTLDIKGTDFQKQVWQALIEIPYGVTHSYQDQAHSIGKPKAVRAVANANGMNLISIIIPCHRIIGANGSLTGYSGGIWRKSWLLNFEKENNQTIDD